MSETITKMNPRHYVSDSKSAVSSFFSSQEMIPYTNTHTCCLNWLYLCCISNDAFFYFTLNIDHYFHKSSALYGAVFTFSTWPSCSWMNRETFSYLQRCMQTHTEQMETAESKRAYYIPNQISRFY